MKKTLPLFFLLFLLQCFFAENSRASHSMGADLTYTCLGGNNYKLRLSFYRDCYGVAADISPIVTISSVSCGQSFTVYLDTIPGTGQEITPLCPSATSTCNGGTYTGIQEWVYEGVVTLPAQCTDWEFSYDLCCRNAAITTVSGPSSEDIYVHSFLNNTITPCNNSPTFTNKPVPFVCLGQEFCFNHGAYDVDGDSLAYSLITPLGASGVPITYLNPYSATQPLNSVPTMTFDPLSGDFCATPQSIQVTVMAVMVKEYRNGVLIGKVERDIQITVIPCNNNLPGLTGINGTNNYTATICADEPFCFDIFSNDPDAGQNVSVSWDTSIIAGAFNTSGSPYPTGTFCWTPTQGDVSPNSHCFTVRVRDDACPYFGSQIYSYCLTVVNVTADAGPDQAVACNNTVTITAIAGGTAGTYTYQWSNGSTSASQSVGAGIYTITVSNGLCIATDEVTVSPLSGPAAAFSATGVCIGTTAGFTDQTTITSGNITGWSWNFGDGNTSVQQNPVHQYASPGTYNVCLIAYSDVNCTDTICQLITVSNPPVAGFNVPNVCDGETINITNTSTPAGSISSYDWDLGNGSSSILQNPSVLYGGASTYTITLIVTDTLGCADTLQQQVIVYPLPTAAFTINYNACQPYQASFTDNSSGNITSWSWTFGDGQTSTQQNPVNVYNSTGTYDITLVVTTADGCTDSIT
ncbi:MAG: PKD domain-containing protein, partial [Bacteroidota bacterium]